MKKITWLAVGLIAAALGMAITYGIQRYQHDQAMTQVDFLLERQAIAQKLILGFTEYRRQSATFRKLNDAEISQIKNKLKTDVSQAITKLDSLSPTPEERAWTQSLNQMLADFFVLSAKLEPQLFLRDVFQKDEAQAAFNGMVKVVNQINQSAHSHYESVKTDTDKKETNLSRAWIGLGAGFLALVVFLFMSIFLSYIRPIRQLQARSRAIQSGKFKSEKPLALRGAYAEVAETMDELALLVESSQRDRQNFVTAVTTDLRVPIIPLQTSAHLLASVGDQLTPEQRAEAFDVVIRSVGRISRMLEDLGDALQVDRGDIRLAEKTMDLRELLGSSSSLFTGAGATHEVRINQPSLPIWGMVDRPRMERVLMHLISKVIQYAPEGGIVDLTVNRVKSGGVEFVIAPLSRERTPKGAPRASGPEQDVLAHWVSENGFGLTLAQRIAEAHGGKISAAGLAGTSVVFTVRLPEERMSHQTPFRTGVKTLLQEQLKSMVRTDNA